MKPEQRDRKVRAVPKARRVKRVWKDRLDRLVRKALLVLRVR